jgi:hypothetical protein
MEDDGVLEAKIEESGAEEIDERVRDEAAGGDGSTILANSGTGSYLSGLHLAKDI